MSIEQKVELFKQEQADKELKRGKEGKFRKETWREKIGTFRIMWIFLWGVLAGGSWIFTALNAPELFNPRVVHIQIANANVAEDDTFEAKIEPKKDNIEELMDDVWLRESTRGKNNYSKCEAINKINGIGYGISGNGEYVCFNSHEEEMAVLKGRILYLRATGLSDKEIMCLYSGNNYDICR